MTEAMPTTVHPRTVRPDAEADRGDAIAQMLRMPADPSAPISGLDLARAVRGYFKNEPAPQLKGDRNLWILAGRVIEAVERWPANEADAEADAAMIALCNEAIREERAAMARCNAAADQPLGKAEPKFFDHFYALLERVTETRPVPTVYYYHRASGRRLVGEPGTAEFLASLEDAARAAASERSTGTVSWLIRQYCNSRQWKKLADSTRGIGRLNLKAVEEKWGATPLKHVENPKSRAIFLKWHDGLADTHPRAADNKLAALARVFSWGLDRGHLDHNPVATFERAYQNDRAENIWLPEHVSAFEGAASAELRLALSLALHTGQRQGDLLRLPWSAFDGSAITLKQGKSRRKVWIPCTIALREALEAAPRRATTILTKDDGNAWTKSAFYHAWTDAFAAARLTDDLHFHDLRGTAVTMLSEAGCIPQEIATITGWKVASVNRILEKYLARTKPLAQSAVIKLDAHRRNAK